MTGSMWLNEQVIKCLQIILGSYQYQPIRQCQHFVQIATRLDSDMTTPRGLGWLYATRWNIEAVYLLAYNLMRWLLQICGAENTLLRALSFSGAEPGLSAFADHLCQ